VSVYQLRTFSDLVSSIREELGVPSTDTNAVNRIKRDVNIVYAEIISRKKWHWLSGSVDLTLPAYINAGTASVTQNSATVTLSVAPATSKSNYFFSIDGYSEIYTINSHTAASTTVKLANEYTGTTNTTATYKIWTNRIALPTDCKETSQVWHDTYRRTLENVGRQEFRRISTQLSRNEGPPLYYHLGDYVDPAQTSSVTSLPAVSTRSSSLMRKSIVFSSAIPTAIVTKVTAGEPIRWRISGAGHPSYNGDILISSISTTSTANDTMTYTGVMEYTESATADSGMSIVQLDQEQDYDRYRELFLYPCLSNSRQTLHVDYYKDVLPLDNDSDEPVIPLEDRIVLRYGSLHLSWSRVRNNPEAQRNYGLYEAKLAQMEGKWQDSLESPRIIPSKNYLSAKRNHARKRALDDSFGPMSAGGSGAGQTITGAASSAAIFGVDGILQASPTVSSTELSYLDGVTSAVQTQIDSKQASGNYVTALTGDVTASGPGSVAATIAANAVTNAKAAQMATNTIKGNNTGGTANALDLTATQTTAMLNAMVGDAGAGGTKGLVPAPAAGDTAAAKFLKANGTWDVPSGAGSVSSVALTTPSEFTVAGSPITTSGTLAISKANQNANLIYAGPASGAAAAPAFRALTSSDLPLVSRKDIFTASGTWTKPATVLSTTIVKVTVVGGGGGGGAGADTAAGAGGSGGGGGGTAILWVVGSSLGSTESVTIGAGGTAGTQGNPGSNGVAGGTTSFGAHCSATGGAGGTSATGITTAPGAGVAGGVGSSGTLNISGNGSGAGSAGQAAAVTGGGSSGGSSFMGGGGSGANNIGNGGAGGNYGGGGGGGSSTSTGGAGAGGVVILEWVG